MTNSPEPVFFTQELKDKWLKALRSKKRFTPLKQKLCNLKEVGKPQEACCLGVLGILTGLIKKGEVGAVDVRGVDSPTVLFGIHSDDTFVIGLCSNTQSELAESNDTKGRYPIEEIKDLRVMSDSDIEEWKSNNLSDWQKSISIKV